MYTIGEVAKKMNLSVPTIRYYDEEGLLIDVKRDASGNRVFDDRDLRALTTIRCLKDSGLKIREIREFMNLCKKGNDSLEERLQFFYQQKENVKKEIDRLERCMDLVTFKIWYYQTALELHDENFVKNMPIENFPEDIRECFLRSHPEAETPKACQTKVKEAVKQS